jgi:hypothetical protein
MTSRTGLLVSQQARFLLEQLFDGSLGDSTGRTLGELFDIVGIKLQLVTDLLLDTSRHDFSPVLGHALNARRIHQR